MRNQHCSEKENSKEKNEQNSEVLILIRLFGEMKEINFRANLLVGQPLQTEY